MAEPFIGEIRLFPYGRVPSGWAPCNGQILSINTNQALFSLLGTTYGGNGQTTFGLPDLRGRVPIGFGNSPTVGTVALGEASGEANHTLTLHELPAHVHMAYASNVEATEVSPQGNVWAASTALTPYATTPNGLMNQAAVGLAGSSQPHENMQPYNVVQYCIALVGIYPSRN